MTSTFEGQSHGIFYSFLTLGLSFSPVFIISVTCKAMFLSSNYSSLIPYCCPSFFKLLKLTKLCFCGKEAIFQSHFDLNEIVVFVVNRKVIWRSFLRISHKFQKSAKIANGKIISVIETAKIFRKVFLSKQTSKMQTNLETPKKIPEENFQNS